MPVVARALTDKEITKRIKAIQEAGKYKTFSVGGVTGLVMRVTPYSASYSLRLQKNGFKTMNKILDWNPSKPTLAKAREIATSMLVAFNETGETPRERFQADKAKLKEERLARKLDSLTLDAVIDEWAKHMVDSGHWTDKRAEQREKARIRKAFNPLLNVPLHAITPKAIADLLNPIYKNNHATAIRVRTNLYQLFSWLQAVKGLDMSNPVERREIDPLLIASSLRGKQENHPSLEIDQLKRLMRVLDFNASLTAKLFRFSIYTAVRSNSVRSAQWDQLCDKDKQPCNPENWYYWVIPAKNMKVSSNGDHIVPLSKQAKLLLIELWQSRRHDTPLIFPAKNGHPLSDMAMTQLLKRFDQYELESGKEGFIDRAMSRKNGERVRAVPHGICRSAITTWCYELGKDPISVELILHHKIDKKYNGAYNRAEKLDERLEILQEWADLITQA